MTRMQELTSLIISMDEIVGKLNSFFTDSVILKLDYSIQALGSDVEVLTGFTSGELAGEAFTKMCADETFRESLDTELLSGCFTDTVTTFLTKDNQPISVCLSGFYLGLISDINGYIILKVRLFENSTSLKQELVTKKRELDTFIYRAAHDLRGPLATIKGLVNLMRIRQGDSEVDELNELIEVHANKLDDRLFKLLYLSDTNGCDEGAKGVTHFDSVKFSLEKTMSDNFQINRAMLSFKFPKQTFCEVQENRLLQLLNNILLYIISLPVATLHKEDGIRINFQFEVLPARLHVIIKANGFLVDEKIKNVIMQPESLYNDILTYPFLFNYYVAQREARQCKGSLQVNIVEHDEQVVKLVLPISGSLSSTRSAAEKSDPSYQTKSVL